MSALDGERTARGRPAHNAWRVQAYSLFALKDCRNQRGPALENGTGGVPSALSARTAPRLQLEGPSSTGYAVDRVG